jgi:hypothetical protein
MSSAWDVLNALRESIPNADWINLLSAVQELVIIYGSTGLNVFETIEHFPTDYKSQLMAEYWAVVFSNREEANYNIVVALDTVASKMVDDPSLLAQTLAKIQGLSRPFTVVTPELYSPSVQGINDIVEEALNFIAAVNSEVSYFKSWALIGMLPLLRKNPAWLLDLRKSTSCVRSVL